MPIEIPAGQEDFVDAVLADPKMTKDKKIRWLHAAAKDRAEKLGRVYAQIADWADNRPSSADMLAFLKEVGYAR